MSKKGQIRLPAPPAGDNPIMLCNEISRICHRKMRESCDIDGILSQPGARLIMRLLSNESGLCQKDIVSATQLRAPTVSVILQKMRAEGLVEILPDENDRRVTKVTLTDKGYQKHSQRIKNIEKIDIAGMKDLSQGEIDTLMSLLTKIRNSLLDSSEAEKNI